MVASSGPQSAPRAIGETSPTAGQVAGDYQLVRRIGRGAMGDVWVARHARTSGVAAIKLLRDDSPRTKDRMRRFFARERRAVARLSHPNIVPLFELGEDFIAMRYIEGPTLARRLGTPIDPSYALDIAIQIASALAHAHAHGVVHRDVKPSNILLDNIGNAYLADFGLAALLDDADSAEDRGGTPQYMAPEQARGDAAGPAADQFALGCVLAEMLVGGRIAADADAVTDALPKTLPRTLVEAIRRAIDPVPDERWPSIEEFATALRALDLTNAPAPQRLLPEIRLKVPFGWAAQHDSTAELAPAIHRANYKLSTLEAAGVISPEAARAFRDRTGYAEFGWSVIGRTDRLGPLSDPRAYARASELVVMLHGGMASRESWVDVATYVAQGNGQTLVLVPDLAGYGESVFAKRPARHMLGAAGTLDGVLAWLELVGLRDFPLVLVGHSLAAVALLAGSDADLGPRTWRVAVGPVVPAHDWRQRWGLRMLPALGMTLAWLPGMKRLIGTTSFVWSPAARAYTVEERGRMLAAFMALPTTTLVRGAREYARAKPAPSDQLSRCAIVLSENDPVAPIDRMLRALREVGIAEHQIHRLVSEGHVPHGNLSLHPEWTQRNVIELVAIIEQNLVAAREGTVLPTQVASTLMSDGTSGTTTG